MDSAAREKLARQTLGYSNADQSDVLVISDDSALTRFTHEVSNQNVAGSDAAISVRAIVDCRTGVAQTNRIDDASLKDTVRRAIEMARLAPRDPLVPLLPTGGAFVPPPDAFDASTATADAAIRARLCEDVFSEAERAEQWSAGFASTSATGYTVANSSGALASFDGTRAALNVKMNAGDSTGFAESYSCAVEDIDAAAAGARAASKAKNSASPQAVEPGEWTVIFEPPAFGELFIYLSEHFSAQAFDEGSSFCSDGLDRQYLGENVSAYDDFLHPLNPGMPFDFEGQPTQRLTLVENGVVRNVVTDSYYAAKLGRDNTGHALPPPNAYGPHARNLVVGAGTKPFDQLVAETKRGLLVTRLWYVRTVDRKKATVTGMTRDGTFLIENGRISHGVRNLRFNDSLLEMLRNCELAADQVRTGGYHYSIVVPAIKVEGFTFTSTTEF